MKHAFTALLICALTLVGPLATAQQPIDDTMSYQGSLLEAGLPAEGSYDLRFRLFDGPDTASGLALAEEVRGDVDVTGGIFNVYLDFGPDIFDHEARWIEVAVRDGGSTGSYVPLAPFTPVTPAPQSQFALEAGLLDGFSAADFALTGHDHAALAAGTGLAGATYTGTGSATFSVDFGTTAGQVAPGDALASVNAGAGLSGGTSSNPIGDGFSATLNVDFGTAAGQVAPGDALASVIAGDGLAGGTSSDAIGDGFSTTLSVGADAPLQATGTGLRIGEALLGDGLVNAGTATNVEAAVGAGDGIAVAPGAVSARVDGTTIGINGSGELTALAGGGSANYARTTTVAKSGGDYADPVAAMNDLATWCGTTPLSESCVIRVMPGVYFLSATLELVPGVAVVGASRDGSALVFDNNGSAGTVDASACINACVIANLTVAGRSTDGATAARAITSTGGRLDLRNVFIIATSTDTPEVFGIETDSDLDAVDLEIFWSAQAGAGLTAAGGRTTLADCRIEARDNSDGSNNPAIRAVQAQGTRIESRDCRFEAVSTTSAYAVDVSGQVLRDSGSTFRANGDFRSRALMAADCPSNNHVSLRDSRLIAEEGFGSVVGGWFDNCTLHAHGIDVSATWTDDGGILDSDVDGLLMRSDTAGSESDLRLAHASVITSHGAAVSPFNFTGTSAVFDITHSRLEAPGRVASSGSTVTSHIAFSQLVGSGVAGTGSVCRHNVDGAFNDLGNTCP